MYKKFFTLSFDDGPEQDKKLIRLLKKYDLGCSFNLNSGMGGERHRIPRMSSSFFGDATILESFRPPFFEKIECNIIPRNEVAQVYAGFEISSHGTGHKMQNRLSSERLQTEIAGDLQKLSEITGYKVRGHAYPYGAFNDKVIDCLRNAGVIYARTAASTKGFGFPEDPYRFDSTCKFSDPEIFGLVDAFISAEAIETDLLFCVWGHSFELDFNTERSSWYRIEKIFEKIAGRKGIEYCTVIEAFERRLEPTGAIDETD